MRIIGFVLILTFIMMGIGSNLSLMIDGPSTIIVIGGCLALLLFSGQNIGNMFSAVFSGNATSEQLLNAADAWRLAAIFALALGGIGTIIGLVIMLANMEDPAAIGPGMAIGLLTIFYGLFVAYAVAMPLEMRLRQRAAG